jgi:HAMP domain-containing protein
MGRPLSDFSIAANEIAAGREAVISVNENRKDELGVLSIAFKNMSRLVSADRGMIALVHEDARTSLF